MYYYPKKVIIEKIGTKEVDITRIVKTCDVIMNDTVIVKVDTRKSLIDRDDF